MSAHATNTCPVITKSACVFRKQCVVFNSTKNSIKIIWNGAALQGDSWVIPKGAPNKDLAMLFIAWQSLPEVNWRTSKYISYGPVNKKSFDKVDPLYKGALPTDFVDVQVETDFSWWSQNYSRELERWNEWKLK